MYNEKDNEYKQDKPVDDKTLLTQYPESIMPYGFGEHKRKASKPPDYQKAIKLLKTNRKIRYSDITSRCHFPSVESFIQRAKSSGWSVRKVNTDNGGRVELI